MEWSQLLGRMLLAVELILAGLGLLLLFGGRLGWLGRLPGDIHYQKDDLHLYFPITTGLLLSGVLTLLFYLLGRLRR